VDASLLSLAIFALLLTGLAWSSGQISLMIQRITFWLTGSLDMAMVVLFLIYLPGIVVHEGAHWVAAKLLGLKTGRFRVWPKKQGKYIGLGSVHVSRGGVLADSLVGLAPLLAGSLLITWIGTQIFSSQTLGDLWLAVTWQEGLAQTLRTVRGSTDGALWGYLIFTVANAMLPSRSDREPLKPLMLYLGLVALLYLLIDQSGRFFLQVAGWLSGPVSVLSSAFLLTLLINLVILLALFFLYSVLTLFIRPPARG
jgi:hypothetical protein